MMNFDNNCNEENESDLDRMMQNKCCESDKMMQSKCNCNCKFEFEPKNDCMNNDDMTREEMAQKLKCYRFAIIELGLYLDTHPDDEKAICLHKEYANKFENLADKYQKMYGPLTIMFPCNKWRWLEEPWVSEVSGRKSLVTAYL